MQPFHRRLGWAVLLAVCCAPGAARAEEQAAAKDNEKLQRANAAAVEKRKAAEKQAAAKARANKKADEKKENRRPAAAAAPAAAAEEIIFLNNGVIALRKNQFRAQLRQQFQIELAYVKRVCEPTPEQIEKLKPAAMTAIDEVVDEYLKKNKGRRGGIGGAVFGQQGGGQVNDSDLRRSVQTKVKKIVDETLRLEQAARYLDELTKRNESETRAMAQFFVACLDEKLGLTPQQRDEILAAVIKENPVAYNGIVNTLHHNPQYLPQLPDKCVVGSLTDEQKLIWRSINKLSLRSHTVFHGGNGRINAVDDFELPADENAEQEQADGGDQPAGVLILN